MNFYFNPELALGYRSRSQKARVMSERWVADNIFCPACGNAHIATLANNLPAADFQCKRCGEIYELKSKNKAIGKKIADGAYVPMLERITSVSNPHLLVLQYSDDFQVVSLTLIPKFFFLSSIIEKRKPLSEHAHRAGWTGCNILYSEIPEQGKISIIDRQQMADKKNVVDTYARVQALQLNDMESRGWLLDILSCVNAIPSEEFSLQEIYHFTDYLQQAHLHNHHIKAKIRQQLQILRDSGFIIFLGNGRYRKVQRWQPL